MDAHEEPGSLAIKQIRDAGLKINLIGTLAMGSDRFLKRLDTQKLDGMVQYNAFPPNARTQVSVTRGGQALREGPCG